MRAERGLTVETVQFLAIVSKCAYVLLFYVNERVWQVRWIHMVCTESP